MRTLSPPPSLPASRLPISALRQPLIDSLTQHDVVVVGGETGSGKTTQVWECVWGMGLAY
jgi:ATP-dependent helicase HrpA